MSLVLLYVMSVIKLQRTLTQLVCLELVWTILLLNIN